MHDIAHVITRLDLGGAQQNTLYCVEHHDRSRYRVHLAAGPGGLLDRQALGIAEAEVCLMPVLRHPIRPHADLAAVTVLARWLRHRGIDLVHTHSSKAGILGRLAARRAGTPAVVHTVHGWSFNTTQPALVRALYVWLERWAASWTDRLVVVAEANIRQGLAAGIGRPEQYCVVHSGIDVDAFAAPAGRVAVAGAGALACGDGELLVGTVACLKPQKDPLTLVRAARRVVEAEPRARFVVAGDGALRPRVEALAAELGLGDRLVLLGWVDDVRSLLHSLDVLVLTSRFEGLPRAVLQAMAAGVPVVATEVDGVPEVISDGETGRLVAPGDDQAVADAVLDLLADPARRTRLACAAQERLRGSFEISTMLSELEAIYAGLLARAH
jgi:glycosyltransferase involved in cell wall biosynthesis